MSNTTTAAATTKITSRLKNNNTHLYNSNSIIISQELLEQLRQLSRDATDSYSDIIERLIECVDEEKFRERERED